MRKKFLWHFVGVCVEDLIKHGVPFFSLYFLLHGKKTAEKTVTMHKDISGGDFP